MRSLPLGGQQGINIYEQEQTLTLRSPPIYNGQVYILFCFLFFFFISIDSLASTYPGNANAARPLAARGAGLSSAARLEKIPQHLFIITQ